MMSWRYPSCVPQYILVQDANGVARVGAWTIGPDTVALGNLLRAVSPGLWEFTFLATGTR